LGRKFSAGTYDSHEEALKHAQRAEHTGGSGGYKLAMNLKDYLEEWVLHTDLMPMTKKNYESVLRKHVIPILGRKLVGQITRADVRQMLDVLRQEGFSPYVRRQAKASLGSALQELVERDQLDINPTHKISIKAVDTSSVRNVLQPSDFKRILESLPTEGGKLFAQTLIASGLRFGEASELRVRDINFVTDELYVQRRVSDMGAVRNDGERFLVLAGTKSGRARAVGLHPTLLEQLAIHIEVQKLGDEDLLFSKEIVCGGRTAPSRANRSGHLPRDTWRRMWKQAVGDAKVSWLPRTHDLRHANATMMLKNGIDLHEVKERLGHSSIRTTEVYLHRLKTQQSKASQAVSEFL
jgi:integrase